MNTHDKRTHYFVNRETCYHCHPCHFHTSSHIPNFQHPLLLIPSSHSTQNPLLQAASHHSHIPSHSNLSPHYRKQSLTSQARAHSKLHFVSTPEPRLHASTPYQSPLTCMETFLHHPSFPQKHLTLRKIPPVSHLSSIRTLHSDLECLTTSPPYHPSTSSESPNQCGRPSAFE